MKNINKLFILLFISIILGSCSNEDFEDIKPEKPNHIKDPSIVNLNLNNFTIHSNVLDFKNRKAFLETFNALNSENKIATDKWEIQEGFVSMQNVFNKYLEQEEEWSRNFMERNKGRTLDELRNNFKIPKFPVVNKYPGAIELKEDKKGCKYYDVTVDRDEYLRLISPEGLLKIGKKIYYFNGEKVYIIKGKTLDELTKDQFDVKNATKDLAPPPDDGGSGGGGSSIDYSWKNTTSTEENYNGGSYKEKTKVTIDYDYQKSSDGMEYGYLDFKVEFFHTFLGIFQWRIKGESMDYQVLDFSGSDVPDLNNLIGYPDFSDRKIYREELFSVNGSNITPRVYHIKLDVDIEYDGWNYFTDKDATGGE